MLPPPGLPQVFRTLLVSDAGQARWGLELRPRTGPPGDPVTVEVLDAQGNVLTQVVAYHELVADGDHAYFVPAAHTRLARGAGPGRGANPLLWHHAEPTLHALARALRSERVVLGDREE